jgi:hypothetical protein
MATLPSRNILSSSAIATVIRSPAPWHSSIDRYRHMVLPMSTTAEMLDSAGIWQPVRTNLYRRLGVTIGRRLVPTSGAASIMPASLPSPLSASDFLDWMRTNTPGLYLLGSLNRHITVYSQQRRAINLVRALMTIDGGLDGKSVAVVGAGFAGLTTAAFMLEGTTAAVSLFDVAPRPLWLQDGCANRWLHPGIYDWPLPGSLEPWTSLPVLNWRAGPARDVVAQVRSAWDRIAATSARLDIQLETCVRSVEPAAGRLQLNLDRGAPRLYDIIVLAVGFGLEPGGGARVSYWNDADGLDGVKPSGTVLISGFGDGGLSDVLRLCLPSFRQDSLVELVRHVPADVRSELVRWEQDFQSDSAALDERYRSLRVESMVERLANAPPATHVTLAGKGHLYGPRSAILNRFLVSQLQQALGDNSFTLIPAAVDETTLTELPGGKRSITLLEAQGAREFDHIVLRLGPQPVYSTIAPLDDWRVGTERRKHWYEMPQSLDRTRVLIADQPAEAAGSDEAQSSFLAYESSSRPWCLVLRPAQTQIDWPVLIRLALAKASGTVAALNQEPLVMVSHDAFENAATLRSAVRALCAADIVIADVTDYDPASLLLLGIRAAVRRSVTIACTKRDRSPEFWRDLPFNLKELNLVSLYNTKQGYAELVEALAIGLTQSRSAERYLDLPVYDYVRESAADEAPAAPARVLFLRSFVTYTPERELFVQSRIRHALGLPDARVEAVIDQASPRLAGQRLYEAIRHWEFCVVDLTWWRPNVLFELGVRLAVSRARTFCIIDRIADAVAADAASTTRIDAQLAPHAYDASGNKFSKALLPLDTMRDIVFGTAARHFRRLQDRHGDPVDDMLLAAEAATGGQADPLEAVDLTPLYSRDNDAYGGEVRHAVFERLCAAWYYLAEREKLYAIRPIDLLEPRRCEAFRDFRRLGSRLKAALAHRYEPRDHRLRKRIDATERWAQRSGADRMARLLEAWAALVRDPPWQVDPASIPPADRDAQIDDWKVQLAELKELETSLEKLGNRVCELPLQSVRSDVSRLRAVLINSMGVPNV